MNKTILACTFFCFGILLTYPPAHADDFTDVYPRKPVWSISLGTGAGMEFGPRAFLPFSIKPVSLGIEFFIHKRFSIGPDLMFGLLPWGMGVEVGGFFHVYIGNGAHHLVVAPGFTYTHILAIRPTPHGIRSSLRVGYEYRASGAFAFRVFLRPSVMYVPAFSTQNIAPLSVGALLELQFVYMGYKATSRDG